MSRIKKIAFIVGHDAYLKGAKNIAATMRDVDVSWFSTSSKLINDKIHYLDLNQLKKSDEIVSADIVFVGLGGKSLNFLLNHFYMHCIHRPKIIAYFPGVLHLRIFEALATRLLCDEVWLNCERDYRLYQQLARITTGKCNGILFGAPWIRNYSDLNIEKEDIDLLFIEQSIVPATLNERVGLIRTLIGLAKKNPSSKIVIAIRAIKGNESSHKVDYCLYDLVANYLPLPENLSFLFDDIDILIARSKSVATVSSSALYAAIAWGKKSVFINDFGVCKQYGNQLFATSGLMHSLETSLNDDNSSGNPEWIAEYISPPNSARCVFLTDQSFESLSLGYIPRVNMFNIGLFFLLSKFYWQYGEFSFVEVKQFFRSIKNINSHIWRHKEIMR